MQSICLGVAKDVFMIKKLQNNPIRVVTPFVCSGKHCNYSTDVNV